METPVFYLTKTFPLSNHQVYFLFVLKGLPGPVGPVGSSGPNGEKVRNLQCLCYTRCLVFTELAGDTLLFVYFRVNPDHRDLQDAEAPGELLSVEDFI